MITVAGSNSVNAVYNVEYHKVPTPTEKSGPQAPSPGMYLYGATAKNGGMHRITDMVQPTPNPINT